MTDIVQAFGPWVVAACALAGTVYTSLQGRRADDKKVDAEAYDRARAIDVGSIDRLEVELTKALARTDACLRRCAQLEQALQTAGIPIPPVDLPFPERRRDPAAREQWTREHDGRHGRR